MNVDVSETIKDRIYRKLSKIGNWRFRFRFRPHLDSVAYAEQVCFSEVSRPLKRRQTAQNYSYDFRSLWALKWELHFDETTENFFLDQLFFGSD